jgi:Spy/CpxP family protein refolding chaperone
MLAATAVLGLTFANAQTSTTNVTTDANSKPVTHRPTVEVRAERSAVRVKDELKLSDEQYKKVYDTKLAAYNKLQEVNEKYRTAENKDAHKADNMVIHDDYMKTMKGILSADQYAQWEKSNADRYERWKKAATSQPQAPQPDLEEHKMRIDFE